MRTIESPGVEINERDLSFNTELPYGTTSLVVGYAKQGPTDELLNVTSQEELEQIYGDPENAAERYMYHTALQVLNARGNLLVTRLPYGSGDGEGYGTKYSALVYPFIPVDLNNPTSTYSTTLCAEQTKNITLYSISSAEHTSNLQTPVFSIAGLASGVASVPLVGGDQFTLFNVYVSGVSVPGTFDFDVSGSVVSVGSIEIYGEMVAASAQANYGDVQIPVNDSYYIILSSNSVDSTFYGDISGAFEVHMGIVSAPASMTIKNASHYFIGEPIHIAISDATYSSWLEGGIPWQSTLNQAASTLLSKDYFANGSTNAKEILENIGYAGMIIVNENKTVINDKFEGFYIAIADNSRFDKGSNFDSVLKLKSFNQYSGSNNWVDVNPQSLAFTLSGTYYDSGGNISEIVESVPDFDFSNNGPGGFGDSLVVASFRVRPSIYDENERLLDKTFWEAHIGSLDSARKIQNQQGGKAKNFFLESVVNESSNNLKVFVNPSISNARPGTGSLWYDPVTQEPRKFVRVVTGERDIIGSSSDDVIGNTVAQPNNAAKIIFDKINTKWITSGYCKDAANMYGIGEFVPCDYDEQKYIGNLPRKLEKALRLAENYELLRLDLVPEGGLGTVWTGMNLDMNNWPANTNRRSPVRKQELFDDEIYIEGILDKHPFDRDNDFGLRDQKRGSSAEARDLYETIFNVFNQFCQFTRKDCLQIADPLRYIFVQGNGDVKVIDNRSRNFSQHIFWPLKNLYGGMNTSYACTYANWFKINDNMSDRFVWIPPSGYMANLMIKTDVNFFPWFAPAGLTRGIISGILDIGINPTQKQRDLLYKSGINPTVYWPGDGYVVWGQKTLQKKPSAFDRINVRRLFLWAEKAVLQIARYFVFEQNTQFTRNRLKNAIDPVLAFAKSNEGIYDYLIVCDDNNNPPEVIDRNELVVDIYIKPVRVAEYILINFIATRTGQRFDELI